MGYWRQLFLTFFALFLYCSQVNRYKERPGISSFADNLDGLDLYIANLVEKAAEYVPEEQHHKTVLYFMATAGRSRSIGARCGRIGWPLNEKHCV